MSINLADDAIHALNRSAAAAARDGADAVEPPHILAGVLSQGDSALRDACRRLGLEVDDLPPPMLNLPVTYENHLPFTPSSHEVLAAAVAASSSCGHPTTTSVHLLLGVARNGDPETARVLSDWGLMAGDLERELQRMPALEEAG